MPTADADSPDARPAPRSQPGGGDYVGGHQIIHMTAGGDIVSGDKITTIIGDPAAAANLKEALARIDALIGARADDPAVEMADIK